MGNIVGHPHNHMLSITNEWQNKTKNNQHEVNRNDAEKTQINLCKSWVAWVLLVAEEEKTEIKERRIKLDAEMNAEQ